MTFSFALPMNRNFSKRYAIMDKLRGENMGLYNGQIAGAWQFLKEEDKVV